MKIEVYKDLIAKLPFLEQAFTTKLKTWEKTFDQNEPLKLEAARLFLNDEATISRHDIFNEANIHNLILKTIFWGYPRGMRGSLFKELIVPKNIDQLQVKLVNLRKTNIADLKLDEFKEIKGVGISTITKLLYFIELKVNEKPCLILDRRLINVFQNGTFEDFQSLKEITYPNADSYYISYINIMAKLGQELNVNPQNIETFLFAFGNNLKPFYKFRPTTYMPQK